MALIGQLLGIEEINVRNEIDDHIHKNTATSPLSDHDEPEMDKLKAGEYKKADIKIAGLVILIENPYGTIRKGVDKDGNKWECELKDNYGEIANVEGADGDFIDVFIRPHLNQKELDGLNKVFVIDQIKPDSGKFDEHKIVLGYSDKEDAEKAYLSKYSDGWNGIGAITEFTMDEFKSWLKSDLMKPAVLSEQGEGEYKNDSFKEQNENDSVDDNEESEEEDHEEDEHDELEQSENDDLETATEKYFDRKEIYRIKKAIGLGVEGLFGKSKEEKNAEFKDFGNESFQDDDFSKNKWVGILLDNTWALDDGYQCMTHVKISGPNSNGSINYVPRMMSKIKEFQDKGIKVKLFTYRPMNDGYYATFIRNKMKEVGIDNLELTGTKDSYCWKIFDDLSGKLIFDRETRAADKMFENNMVSIENFDNYDNNKWKGVDLDGTLAEYDGWKGKENIGRVIPKMLDRIKAWDEAGIKVKIFTARAADPESVPFIKTWLEENGIGQLEITNVKDMFMEELWDDRAVQVLENTGMSIAEYHGLEDDEMLCSDEVINSEKNGMNDRLNMDGQITQEDNPYKVGNEEWFKSDKDVEKNFREKYPFAYYPLSERQVKKIPYKLDEAASKIDRVDARLLLQLGFTEDQIKENNLMDITTAGHIPYFYSLHGIYNVMKDNPRGFGHFFGYVKIPIENFHINITKIGPYKKAIFSNKYSYFSGRLITPIEIKDYKEFDKDMIAKESFEYVNDPIVNYLESEFIACEGIGTKFQHKLQGFKYKNQRAYMLITKDLIKNKTIMLGSNTKLMVGTNLGKLIDWRNKQKKGSTYTHYVDVNLKGMNMLTNEKGDVVKDDKYERVGVAGPAIISVTSPKKLPSVKKVAAMESLQFDFYGFEKLNEDSIGLEEFQIFTKIASAISGARSHLLEQFKKNELVGQYPNKSFLYDADSKLDKKGITNLVGYMVYTPEGVSCNIPEYLSQVKIALIKISDLETRLIEPLKQWAGFMLSDNDYHEKVWVTLAVPERPIDDILKPLQKCFDGKQTDNLMQFDIVKAYPNLSLDLKLSSDLLNELIKSSMNVLNQDIATKVASLYGLINRVSSDSDIKAKLPLIEKKKMIKVINLTYQLANEIELLAVLLFQVKLASFAHNKTLEKIKKEL